MRNGRYLTPAPAAFPTPRGWLPGTALLAAALSACQAETGVTADTQVHVEDSAGIRIVEYAGVPSPPTLTLAAEPMYAHGTREGDYTFQNIDQGDLSGVLYPDGSAAIADWGNQEVVRIGADGRSFELIAQAGEGPGEYGGRSPRLIAGGQDTLLAQDTWNRRVLRYAGGSLISTVRLPGADDGTGSFLHGLDGDGHLLMTSSWPSGRRESSDGRWIAGRMFRVDLAGRTSDTVASYDQLPPEPAVRTGTPLFRHGGLASTAGGEFVFGRTDRPELVWRRSDGTIRQIMRWNPEPLYTTREAWERWIACMRDAYLEDPEVTEAMVEQSLGQFEFVGDEPEPYFGRIFSDDQGRIWLGNFTAFCYKTRSYTVIAPDGTWLGVFEPPEGFALLATANGRVLGVETDEMDVESVAVYEVVGW
ncbi:MAG: hypothetical protein F4187_05785 [Gemmatimonadetes bacterium]|nr:hypothetical protein [Gemmatimonadota bacterium]MYI06858.1 hypothetical protein [Gemmatimonadota bacterium]